MGSATVGPVAPTLEQARRLARDEYDWRMIDGRPALLSRGSDGGMHWRGNASSPDAAEQWVRDRRSNFAAQAVAGELTHVLFWRSARSCWDVG